VNDRLRLRYVERVREATRALFEDLLDSNRRLGLTLSVLGAEREDASRDDLNELNKRSERWRAEQDKLLEMLAAVDRDYKRFEEQFYEVERQNANLSTLYAAGYALHACFRRDAVLAAIQEIVINLLGSEEFAIVRADERLSLLASFGLRPGTLVGLTRDSGIIGRAFTEGSPLALPHGMPTDVTRVRVCIPLSLDGRVVGFVLIFSFLPQKDDLSALDHELFSLVGNQAGAALHVSETFTEVPVGAA
jgi:hypothetical protein